MKNTVLALACMALIVFFGSCTKSSTCTCTTHTTLDGEPMIEDVTTTATIDGDCSDGNSTTTMQEMVVTVTCK